MTHLLEYLQLDTYGSEQLVQFKTIHKEILLCAFSKYENIKRYCSLLRGEPSFSWMLPFNQFKYEGILSKAIVVIWAMPERKHSFFRRCSLTICTIFVWIFYVNWMCSCKLGWWKPQFYPSESEVHPAPNKPRPTSQDPYPLLATFFPIF